MSVVTPGFLPPASPRRAFARLHDVARRAFVVATRRRRSAPIIAVRARRPRRAGGVFTLTLRTSTA
jgi:hypothetical protein